MPGTPDVDVTSGSIFSCQFRRPPHGLGHTRHMTRRTSAISHTNGSKMAPVIIKMLTTCPSARLPASCPRVPHLLSWAVIFALHTGHAGDAASSCLLPNPTEHPQNNAMLSTFKMNTCKGVSKQRTLTRCRMNTYEKTGGGGHPSKSAHPTANLGFAAHSVAHSAICEGPARHD